MHFLIKDIDKLKIETKKMREKRIDHELLMKTVQDLTELHATHEEDTKQSIKHDELIRNDLHSLFIGFIISIVITKEIVIVKCNLNKFNFC